MKTFPLNATYGEIYGSLPSIQTQEEADAYFEALVRHTMRYGEQTREEAEQLHKAHIGYWSGYYDPDTAGRILRLFKTSHPVFGTAYPTPREAYAAGLKTAVKSE